MKKIIVACLMALVSFGASALPLFPFFVDVVGDYDDKIPEEVTALGIDCKYAARPTFFSTLKEADAFLADVVPDEVGRSQEELHGATVILYKSAMHDDKTSYLYLIARPDNEFWIGYQER